MGECDSADSCDGDVRRSVSSLLIGLWVAGLLAAGGEFVLDQGESDFVAAVQFYLSAESGCLVDEFGVGHSASDVLH